MHDRRVHTVGGRSLEPAPIFSSRPCSPTGKPANDLQGKGCSHATAGSIARIATRRRLVCSVATIALFMCDGATSALLKSSARAQPAARSAAIDRFAKFIDEASDRFAVPARWIRAVMQIESAGNEHATSPRGAMGLMQVMPGAWVELSARHGLGLDPFNPRDNILAGTGYLRELHDRFGSAGFLGAYHAGPARYEQHLATGQPLPPATIAYVTAVTSLLTKQQGEQAAFRIKRPVPWREAPLVVERAAAP